MSALPTWQDRFKARVEKMKAEKLEVLDFKEPIEGMLTWQPGLECECGNRGVYLGTSIDTDQLFKAVDAIYCDSCKRVYTKRQSRPLLSFESEQYLHAFQYELMRSPNLISQTEPLGGCPNCGQPTYGFDIANIENQTFGFHLRVCISGCGWKGESVIL